MSAGEKFSAAAALVALTLVLQCAWTGVLIRWGRDHFRSERRRVFGVARSAWLMVWVIADMIVLHLVQIVLWSGFYRWKCLPSWASAFYFSAANYTTVGAADIVLAPQWRSFGPLESLLGVLMCGLSASFLFAIVTRLVEHDETLLEEEVKEQAGGAPRVARPELPARAGV